VLIKNLQYMAASKQPSKQPSKQTHTSANAITLVWGSLRLAPINKWYWSTCSENLSN